MIKFRRSVPLQTALLKPLNCYQRAARLCSATFVAFEQPKPQRNWLANTDDHAETCLPKNIRSVDELIQRLIKVWRYLEYSWPGHYRHDQWRKRFRVCANGSPFRSRYDNWLGVTYDLFCVVTKILPTYCLVTIRNSVVADKPRLHLCKSNDAADVTRNIRSAWKKLIPHIRPFKVTQGHWHRHESTRHIWFPINVL